MTRCDCDANTSSKELRRLTGKRITIIAASLGRAPVAHLAQAGHRDPRAQQLCACSITQAFLQHARGLAGGDPVENRCILVQAGHGLGLREVGRNKVDDCGDLTDLAGHIAHVLKEPRQLVPHNQECLPKHALFVHIALLPEMGPDCVAKGRTQAQGARFWVALAHERGQVVQRGGICATPGGINAQPREPHKQRTAVGGRQRRPAPEGAQDASQNALLDAGH